MKTKTMKTISSKKITRKMIMLNHTKMLIKKARGGFYIWYVDGIEANNKGAFGKIHFWSYKDMANHLGMSINSVKRSVKHLVDYGLFIEVK